MHTIVQAHTDKQLLVQIMTASIGNIQVWSAYRLVLTVCACVCVCVCVRGPSVQSSTPYIYCRDVPTLVGGGGWY